MVAFRYDTGIMSKKMPRQDEAVPLASKALANNMYMSYR